MIINPNTESIGKVWTVEVEEEDAKRQKDLNTLRLSAHRLLERMPEEEFHVLSLKSTFSYMYKYTSLLVCLLS